jgi:aspartate/methionine/tyrosine aminotransferase
LTTEIGVAAIPPSAFYHNPADGAQLARFAFCKSQPVLDEAARRLQKLVA